MGPRYVRLLDEYPTGRRRLRILGMAVLASLICSYEGQIAPVVPLLLEDLEMSLATYGAISAVAAVAGAVAGIVGGRYTDKVGRVRLLIPLMVLTALCCFWMALVRTPGQFFAAKAAMSFIEGAAIACTAPLVRDFSPRMGRAQAFGFWTWGPVGANFLAAAIAGLTLPLFGGAWQSQLVIMGAVSLVASVVIATNIAELSPALRAKVVQTEHSAVTVVDEARPALARALFTHPTMWAHVVGIAFWLVLYLTLTLFGQTMLVQTFEMGTAQASAVMTVFWVLNLVTLVVAGRWSDRVQLRRPFALGGTIAGLAVLLFFVSVLGQPTVSLPVLMVTGVVLGGVLGAAYSPWMANFSEDAENIDPRLQGTAWGMFSFLVKGMAVVVLLVVPHVVAATSWQFWMACTAGCMALFAVAICFFGGPWRNPPRDERHSRRLGSDGSAVRST
ncbi:MFS transporter [Pseudonocardia sp. MH-G8]|uniref:MFS transporter n=1 Tax=Pseudonocardia sp. MH-G8 TaxID=1854588 RepID=UPI000BA0C661|nr:MFS transporter [Pseudonocardia sp. MH-G8]OZM82712.1 MFS transporter [Pseudonocardia sp. MH-G8]